MRLLPPKSVNQSANPLATPPIAPTNPNQAPKTKTQRLVSPWVWGLFISSVLFCVTTVFVSKWSSTGPTWLPLQIGNPPELRTLPPLLQIPLDLRHLLLPAVLTAICCLGLRYLPPTNGNRFLVKTALILLVLRYFVWRTVATLNFTHWTSTVLSLLLYATEAFCLFLLCLHSLQTIRSTAKRRSQEANDYSEAVLLGEYLPWVDVLIPTYNEPDFILRRTVIGCQAMQYPHKKIYLLDDTRRPQIRQLAAELGCEYITRPDNRHAKAGNLNHALMQTNSELIAVMDADFVPFTNFLTRTVGFFQKRAISLVQTQQNFYNPDHHARNFGVEHLLPHDLEEFFGFAQPCRDAANSVICCGTSYVVRRADLEMVGGYYTRCCVEDFQTSLLMLTYGAKIIYLNEKLSMGESTRTYADYVDQRLRWLQGNLQIYFCGKEVPIWSRLNWVQRTYALSQLLFCFYPLARAAYFVFPVLNAYLGVTPIVASVSEVVYYFLPMMLLNMAICGWSTGYRVSWFWNEVYDTRLCFLAVQRLFRVLRNPFGKVSRVTRKGVKEQQKNYNFHLTLPLIVLILLTLAIIAIHLVGYSQGIWLTPPQNSSVMFFWLIYNAVFLMIAVLSAIDQPVQRLFDRFPLQTICRLKIGSKFYWGTIQDLSEQGAGIVLQDGPWLAVNQPIEVELVDYQLLLKAQVCHATFAAPYTRLGVQFAGMTLPQQRRLVTLLYSDLTWWKASKRPSTLDSLFAMLVAALQLRPIRSQYRSSS